MSDAYLSQINLFAGTFAPRGYAMCEGQMMTIQNNAAIFSLIGCEYGGDCVNTFALPDFRGRVPVSCGVGPGLPEAKVGQQWGTDLHQITIQELPKHDHTAQVEITPGEYSADVMVTKSNGTEIKPIGNILAKPIDSDDSSTVKSYADPNSVSSTTTGSLGGVSISLEKAPAAAVAVGYTGTSLPFEIYQPTLCIRFAICIDGTYPPRN